MNHDQRQALASGSSIATVEESARNVRALQLQASRLRVALFKNLQVESADDRHVALEKIIQVVKSYLRVARSPFSTSSSSETAPVPLTSLVATATSLSSRQVQPSTTNNNDDEGSSSETPTTAAAAADHAATTHDLMPYDDDTNDESMTDEQLRYFLLTMLRLAHTCPFSDVRQTFRDFLQKTADSRVMFAPQASHLSPSIFIPLKDIFSLESSMSCKTFISYPRPEHLSISPWSQDTTDDEQQQQPQQSDGNSSSSNNNNENRRRRPEHKLDRTTSNREQANSMMVGSTGGRMSDEYVRQMMTKTFIDEGRLANLFRVMSFFPTFYEIYSNTYTQILKSSLGPVSRTWKCYLGILAAAEHQCQYLVSMLRLEFLQSGGDPTWLKGIDHCPIKLRRITHLVLKLARQPWRLTADDDLMSLVRRPGAVVSETWSKGELVQAIVVISTFLGLSSFVLGCGIAPEMDMRGGFHVHGQQRGGDGDDEYRYLEGVEHELDEWIPLSPCGLKNNNDSAARAAASTATGWHDSNITFDGSRRSSSGGNDTYHQHQPFTSDNGVGLGVSVDDDNNNGETEEEDQDHHQQEGNVGEKRPGVEQTKNIVHKLKSTGGSPLKNVLLESLEGLNLTNDNHSHYHHHHHHLHHHQQLVASVGDDDDDVVVVVDEENNGQETHNSDSLDTVETPSFSSNQQELSRSAFNQVYEDLSRFTDVQAAHQMAATTELQDDGDGTIEPEHLEGYQVMSGEYCWEDLGCDLVNQFLPELGDGLDEEFNEALSITDWTIFHHTSDSNIDTGPLRRAMWYYTQKVLGLTKEDYDYQDVSTYLSARNKEYIKKVCQRPHEISYSDWSNIGLSLRPEEKCHVNLLIASAKKQALLSYALAAVDQV